MNKAPNQLSRFICQLSGNRKEYRKQFLSNMFNEFSINSPLVKLKDFNQDYTLHLNSEFNNGYASEIHGRGNDIVNALFYGYYTVEDISAIDKISIRTATRLMHPRKSDKYYLKRPHIPHTIQLYNIQDDCFKHYRYDGHMHHYYAKLNNVFGKWKSKTVVDAVTFNHFNWLIHSKFFDKLRDKYKNTTHLQLLHQLLVDKQKIYKNNLKHKIFMKYLDKTRNIEKTYLILLHKNMDCSKEIYRVEESLNDYTPFSLISTRLLLDLNYMFNHHMLNKQNHLYIRWIKLRFTVTDTFMYAYLFKELSKRYQDYKHVYHSDKYHLMTKTRWNILRLVDYQNIRNY